MSRRAMLLTGVAAAALVVYAVVPRSRSAPAPAPKKSTEERRDLLHKSLRAIEDGERESPRDRWDPDYVVGSVGRDPQRLADWVSDYTYWIPYRGELRGATGVLMDGQGNSLDRAVLLATLLEKAGHTVRLAHRELPRDQAVDLLPTLATRRSTAFQPRTEKPLLAADDIRRVSAGYGLDAGGSATKAPQDAFARAAAEARSRVSDQSARLLRHIPAPGPRPDWGRRFSAAVEALRDHWWVEREASGRWIGIDVVDPLDRSHAPIAAGGEVVAVADAPGAGRSHEFTVRVVAERWSPKGLTERRALEHVIRPHEVFGQPVVLQLWPADAIPTDMAAGSMATAPAPPETWGAMLLNGSTVMATGLLQADGDDPAVVKKEGFGGFGDAFANAVGAPRKSEPSVLSAVWIEYEIRAPGTPMETIRRAVFDLIGPDARAATPLPTIAMDDARKRARAAALSMRTEMLPIVCRIAPEYVAHLAAQALLGSRGLLEAVAGNAPPEVLATRLAQDSVPSVSGLYALALARSAWSRRPGIVFDERITLFTRHLTPGVSAGRPVMFDATDIVTSRTGVDLIERDGFAARLEQGVLDTNAEALVRADWPTTGNAGTAFKTSGAWIAVDGQAALARTGLPADTRRRIQHDLSAGYIVVAPSKPIPDGTQAFAGWWRIDPATGEALGIGPHGWGEAGPLGERGAQQNWSRAAMVVLKKMGKQFASVFVVSYLWCVAALGEPKLETEGFRLGVLKATLVASPSECMGDSIAYGVFAAVTVPLLALAAEGSVLAARPPRAPKAPNNPATPPKPAPPEPPSPVECSASKSAPAPELPPEEAAPPPAAADQEGANGTAGPRPVKYGPSWSSPLSPEEFQEYQEYVEINRAEAEGDAAQARDRYRAAAEALERAEAAVDSAADAYEQMKQRNPTREQAAEGLAKIAEARRAAENARIPVHDAERALNKQEAAYSKAAARSDHAKRIAAANQKLYDARQAYERATQKFNDWLKANPTPAPCNTPEWQDWAKARSAYDAARVDFSKADLSSGDPVPAPGSSPGSDTLPQSPLATTLPPPTTALDSTQPMPGALDKTQPVPAGSLDKTQPVPAGSLDKTQPVPAGSLDNTQLQPCAAPPCNVSPLAKTLSGAEGVNLALRPGGQ